MQKKDLDSMGIEKALESVKAFPDQCRQAWSETQELSVPNGYSNIKNIVICGTGGSRFTPLSIKECFSDRLKVPVEISHEYFLPNYVDSNTLVIISSYSGNTEEPVSCRIDAEKRNCKIALITKGGILSEVEKEKQYLSYVFEEKHNPSGQPRLGVGYMLFGHLGLLSKLNLIEISDLEVQEAVDNVVNFEYGEKTKKIADIMFEKEVFIVTSEHLKGFANGFANQINENAKAMSSYRYISELNHHLMEGLSNPKDSKRKWLFLFIKSKLYSEGILKRYPITKEVVEKQGVETFDYELSSRSKLSDLLEAFLFSGYTTLYLSQKYGVDPTKIPWVDYFKEKLGS